MLTSRRSAEPAFVRQTRPDGASSHQSTKIVEDFRVDRTFRRHWARVAPAIAILLSARPVSAVNVPTIYDNAHNFPVGARAAGMGGAYTALACDEGAMHYNVAALACARSSRLELSGNGYVVQSMVVPDAYGNEQDISAYTFHTVPTIFGGVRVFRDADTPEGCGRVVAGLGVSVPASVVLSVDPSEPDDPEVPRPASAVSFRVRDQLLAADLGIGWQATDWLALGLAIGGGMRTFDRRYDALLRGERLVSCGNMSACYPFIVDNAREEGFAIGGRAKVGVRITPVENFSLGLMFTTPTLNFGGSTSISFLVAGAGHDPAGLPSFGVLPVRLDGSSHLDLPARLAFGIAYALPGLVMSLDASLSFPTTVRPAADLEQTLIVGIPEASADDLDDAGDRLELERTWQPNVNLGLEILLVEDVVLDLGGFTDFSSVPSNAVSEDRVHMFGGTAALGVIGKKTRGWFGLSFEMGVADTKVLEGDLSLESLALTSAEQTADSTIRRWTLAGFIGSSYSFDEGD
jgi:hypothetical protein